MSTAHSFHAGTTGKYQLVFCSKCGLVSYDQSQSMNEQELMRKRAEEDCKYD